MEREKTFNRLNFYNDYYTGRRLEKEKDKIVKEMQEDKKSYNPKVIHNYDQIRNKRPFQVDYSKDNFSGSKIYGKKKNPLNEFMKNKYSKFLTKQTNRDMTDMLSYENALKLGTIQSPKLYGQYQTIVTPKSASSKSMLPSAKYPQDIFSQREMQKSAKSLERKLYESLNSLRSGYE